MKEVFSNEGKKWEGHLVNIMTMKSALASNKTSITDIAVSTNTNES